MILRRLVEVSTQPSLPPQVTPSRSNNNPRLCFLEDVDMFATTLKNQVPGI
jgi:hypothetical protein